MITWGHFWSDGARSAAHRRKNMRDCAQSGAKQNLGKCSQSTGTPGKKKKKKANFSPWTQCHNNMGTSRSSRLQGLGHTGACKRRLLKWMPSKIPFHWDAWATVFCCWTFGPRSLGKSDRWFSPNLQSTLTPGHRWLAKVGLRTEDLHY